MFQGTPIDPTTPKGSPEQDGFAFDDALEIGSDDDNDKGFGYGQRPGLRRVC